VESFFTHSFAGSNFLSVKLQMTHQLHPSCMESHHSLRLHVSDVLRLDLYRIQNQRVMMLNKPVCLLEKCIYGLQQSGRELYFELWNLSERAMLGGFNDQTRTQVDLPPGRQAIRCGWKHKRQKNEQGPVYHLKTCLVAKRHFRNQESTIVTSDRWTCVGEVFFMVSQDFGIFHRL